jgi:hypothetical protein
MANALNALARLREGRRKVMSKPKRVEIERGGEDEVVGRFRERCVVRRCVFLFYIRVCIPLPFPSLTTHAHHHPPQQQINKS